MSTNDTISFLGMDPIYFELIVQKIKERGRPDFFVCRDNQEITLSNPSSDDTTYLILLRDSTDE